MRVFSDHASLRRQCPSFYPQYGLRIPKYFVYLCRHPRDIAIVHKAGGTWSIGVMTRCSHFRYLGTQNVEPISETTWHMVHCYTGLIYGGVIVHNSDFMPRRTPSQVCCDEMGRTIKRVAAQGPWSDSGYSWRAKPISYDKCWIVAHEWYVHQIYFCEYCLIPCDF